MEDPVANAILNRYFRRLEQALSDLPADRRAEIVEDLRAHVEESFAAEPERSDATVLAILDRLGDPDEIAQEALADEAAARSDGGLTKGAGALPRDGVLKRRLGIAAAALVAVLAVVVVALGLTSGRSSAGPNRSANTRVAAGTRLLVSRLGATPGPDSNSTCTSSGTNVSATTLESGATQVASGTIDGQTWSLWSKQGENGAAGLEDGGIVIAGRGYGLCPGFPNPAELEMVDPSGGGAGIVYGVIGYPGTAKVDIYRSTTGTFARRALLATPQVRVVNGVAFFIGSLPQSACSYPSLELNSTSAQDSAEHNLGFGQCSAGEQVPITSSQGIWQLPPGHFPANFSGAGRGPGSAVAPVTKNGWLPAADVSGGGGVDTSDCTPQTLSGSEPASTLEAGATQVASGTAGGHSWSVWSKNGQSGAEGLEDGGVVIDGVAHGLCPGFPNPAEMELLEPSGGGDGIAYGVIGYPGTAKVNVYQGTAGTFDTGKLLASTTAQSVNGVGFFITPLSTSACDVPAVELNTASQTYAAEHNLGFSSKDCTEGQLVPISWSQGIWQLPTSGFPNKLQLANGAGGRPGQPTLTNGWLPAGDVSGGGGIDNSECAPQTLSGSEPASTLEAGATQVASGTTDGHSWSVWSKNGQSGADGLENGGVVIDGVAHGLCPGFPNPAELELLEPSGGGDGIAYGVIGYAGTAKVNVYQGTVGTFDTGKLLASTTAQSVNGVGFFIAPLSGSACAVPAVELNSSSANYAAEHNLGFSTKDCTEGQLVPISWSQGVWQLPTSEFPNKFQSTNAGETPGQLARSGLPARPPSRTGPDFSNCSPRTDPATSGQATSSLSDASEVASGTIGDQSWTLWSKHGETGSAAIEDAGVILDGHAYGLCPGFPNPAEFELLDPPGGGHGIVIGVSGYDGPATAKIYVGTPYTFNNGAMLYSGHTISANGTGFFIAQLPKSACDYDSLELSVKANSGASQHNLEFGPCTAGKLATITGGAGAWGGSG